VTSELLDASILPSRTGERDLKGCLRGRLQSPTEARRLNRNIAILAGTLALVTVVSPVAVAQKKSTAKKKAAPARTISGPETGLLGVKLLDNALKVITLYGNPDQIQALGGGGAAGGGGGFGGPGGRGGAGGGGGGGASIPNVDFMNPFDLNPSLNKQMSPDAGGQEFGPPSGGAPFGGPGGRGGFGGPGGPGGFGPGGPGGAGGGQQASSAEYTRWVYLRNGTKIGFVVDKFQRVVQIEAIGLQNQRVKTRRGIGFGSSFGSVLKAYSQNPPDNYDIAGDTVTVKYLTRERVAFRMSRLGSKKAHVVTGIVVAAGK